jgi:RND superfamily putative drug exporter
MVQTSKKGDTMSVNPAARAGRWSAGHWKTATFGWIAFVVAAVVIGGAIGTKQLSDDASPGESGRMSKILDEGFPQPAGESVLIQSRTLTAKDATFVAAVGDVVRRVSATGIAVNVASPLDPANADQISADGRSALVTFDVRGDPDSAGDRIDPIVAAVDEAKAEHPQLFIGEFGDASADNEISKTVGKDLERAGLLSVPVTIAVLVVAFGALVAAAIPLLLALTAVLATMGLLALPSQIWPVDDNVSAVVLLIGLAVGVDYSLFYLKREREERAAGRSEGAALEAAAATSGRAVLISGVTVVIAMAGMFLTGDKTFGSFAMGTIMVVAIAVLGSLTVLPALLSRLGDRVNKARVPLLHRLRRDGDGRFWGWTVDRVMRRPLLAAVLSASVLVALALPALGMKTVDPGAEALPRSLNVVQAYNRLQAAFPGEQQPAIVVVKAPSIDDPEVATGIEELRRRAVANGSAHEPITLDVNKDRTVARIELPIAGNGSDAASSDALSTLRAIVPATVGRVEGVEAGVTGDTASSKDFKDAVRGSAPFVFAFVLGLAFVLLLVSFRSIVIAVKAIGLNLLSVAAAYGVLVLVFQDGVGNGLLGVEYTGGVMAWLPVFLFVILFGLSMDYHVFILSRVREAYDRGMPTEDAVAHGIKTTAGVITSAALVMVFVFSIFGTLSLIMMKQFGVGLAAAVLIDATIVRGVLLPATMKLLGEWNWYLPRWLRWLPTVRLEGMPSRPAPDLH